MARQAHLVGANSGYSRVIPDGRDSYDAEIWRATHRGQRCCHKVEGWAIPDLGRVSMMRFLGLSCRIGSTTLNRGVHEHHLSASWRSCLEGLPRRLGGVQGAGGTLNQKSSSGVQRWSVMEAVMAGVRWTQ